MNRNKVCIFDYISSLHACHVGVWFLGEEKKKGVSEGLR